ncbi:hypothetical protein PFCIP103579_3122 [Prolinoborus fasciculus]|uniref:hypothetical protein n=1 Tax=Acinetobacter lwoffii TaxID=28090 RepID=UPI0002D10522|nr:MULTISPECIES: hypothetical protein [Pseudomonadota]ENW29368.1 hypothetical protein F924_00932 [Acinetobacter lwoffii ATCC 9957 = CIP 70.31]SPJ21978.1 hypothetical protein PFCIP103579_3122 [Prolinoborus fasciculus]
MKKIILLALAIGLLGCGGEVESPKKSNTSEQSGPKKISQYAYNNYSIDQFPRLYAEWGEDWVKRISELEKQAVQKIANEPNTCDSIDMVALSDNRSTPKKEAVFFVDCVNGERFYVSQTDLVGTKEIKSQTQKAISQTDAFDRCRDMVKANAKYPTSVNFKLLDSSGFTAATTGNVVVMLGFEAKNSFGAELPAKARCVFTPEGKGEISIIEG